MFNKRSKGLRRDIGGVRKANWRNRVKKMEGLKKDLVSNRENCYFRCSGGFLNCLEKGGGKRGWEQREGVGRLTPNPSSFLRS